MKTRFFLCGILSWILSNGALPLGAQDAEKAAPTKDDTVAPRAAAPSPSLTEKLKLAAANLSPPVMEIVRMSDAGADTAVIQAFVENSPTAYNLRAEEIIYLHDHGIPASVITAMIQHGARQREKAETTPLAAAPPNPSENTVVQTAPDYTTTPTYVYPSYTYPTYAYGYPSYPYASYPSFGVYFSWPYYYGHSRYGHFSHPGTFHSGAHFFHHH